MRIYFYHNQVMPTYFQIKEVTMEYPTAQIKKQKSLSSSLHKIIFVVYIAIIGKMTLIRGPVSELMDNWTYNTVLYKISTANFVPFHTIKLYIRILPETIAILNLVGNVIGFVPLGYLVPLVFKKHSGFFRSLLFGLLFILFIETTQLVTGLGEFDVDDMILNMLGVLIGHIANRLVH